MLPDQLPDPGPDAAFSKWVNINDKRNNPSKGIWFSKSGGQIPLNIHTKLPVCSNEAFLWSDGRTYVIEMLNPARKTKCAPQEREKIYNSPLHFKYAGNEGVHGLKLIKVAVPSTPKRTVMQGGKAIEVFVGRLSPYLFACHIYHGEEG